MESTITVYGYGVGAERMITVTGKFGGGYSRARLPDDAAAAARRVAVEARRYDCGEGVIVSVPDDIRKHLPADVRDGIASRTA